MTDHTSQHDDLAERLDEAGRWCQPAHPGWDTLAGRLGPQDPPDAGDSASPRHANGRGAAGVWGAWKWLALAASLLIAAPVALHLLSLGPDGSGTVVATNLDVSVERRGVQVTVFGTLESEWPTLYTPVAHLRPTGPAAPNGPGEFFGQQRELAQVQYPAQVFRGFGYGRTKVVEGLGLVKDQRMILRLKKGDNVVKFTDVAATLDPTSVRLVSETDPVGTKVIEQNFEFDLASADALLKRYIDKSIACVNSADEVRQGVLVAYDAESLTLADGPVNREDADAPRPRTEVVNRGVLKAIRLDSVPSDLHTRPTLVWKLRTEMPGDHLTTLSYLCGEMDWRADYVAILSRPQGGPAETFDLNGWVTINNRSGATYDHAGLKVIAGDVNRVKDPWATLPPTADFGMWYDNGRLHEFRSFAFGGGLGGGEPKQLVEKSFFEYKLYTLTQPSTIRDAQIKQLNLLQAQGVPVRRRYIYDEPDNSSHLAVELLTRNDEKHNLGKALPKGKITFMGIDSDGDGHILGHAEIDHTSKNEELKLHLNRAFDVIGEKRTLERRQLAPKHAVKTYEIRIRNHRDHAIDVRAFARPNANTTWKIVETTDPYTKVEAYKVQFDFSLPANSEKVIRYVVDYLQ